MVKNGYSWEGILVREGTVEWRDWKPEENWGLREGGVSEEEAQEN